MNVKPALLAVGLLILSSTTFAASLDELAAGAVSAETAASTAAIN